MNEKPLGEVVTQNEYEAQTTSPEPPGGAGHQRPGAINIVENPLTVCYSSAALTALLDLTTHTLITTARLEGTGCT